MIFLKHILLLFLTFLLGLQSSFACNRASLSADIYTSYQIKTLAKKATERANAKNIAIKEDIAKDLENLAGGKNVVAGNIIYKSDFQIHLTDVIGFTQQKGVIGGHNLANFENYLTSNAIEINRLSMIESSIDGLTELSYQIKKADKSGDWKSTIFKKTLHNPLKISDMQIIQLGKEAIQEGIRSNRLISQHGSNIIIKGKASNGMKFIGYQDPITGKILNFHPVINW